MRLRRRADWRPPVTNWQLLATAVTGELAASGELTDPVWQRAFTEIPRHVFVPDRSPAEAYSPSSLVTQWRATDELGNKRPPPQPAHRRRSLSCLNGSPCRITTGFWRSAPEPATTQHYCATGSARRTFTPPTSIPRWSTTLDLCSTASVTVPPWSPPMATTGSPTAHLTIVSWPPARSPTSRPSGYGNSPMVAVSSRPSPATRPSPSSFWTRQRQMR